MRSDKQREASRKNGSKSRGPKTPEGKNNSKFNNLRHGLCSNQVVLPGESVAEFNAEIKGWTGDWNPRSHTAAVLVERAAIGSWRLRRCVRAESDLLMEIAARTARRRRNGDGDDDLDVMDRVDLAADDLFCDPARSVAELRAMPEGVDRLLAHWDDLADALADGPDDWDLRDHHRLLMALLGHDTDADPAAAGATAVASHRLAVDNRRDDEDGAMTVAEAQATAKRIRAGVARERTALRAHRETLVAPKASEGSDDEDYRFLGVTRKLMLLHRYEMAIERSMRGAMKDLIALEKQRPELGSATDVTTEVILVKRLVATKAEASAGPTSGRSVAPDEPEAGAGLGGSEGARDERGGRPERARRPEKGRSPV